MNVTEIFAKELPSLRWESLPSDVRRAAKLCLADFLATAVAGLSFETARSLLRACRHWAGTGRCAVVGQSGVYSPEGAAFLNATISEILEMGHGHANGGGHLGATTIPVALALAEENDRSGQDALLSIVAGYEVFGKVGGAVHPSLLNQGFISTGLCGCLGAAATSAMALGLTGRELAAALGIAAYLAPVSLLTGYYGTINSAEAGQAAWQGIMAARMAAEGIAGSEDPAGSFCEQFGDITQLHRSMTKLGQEFEITNLYYKLFPGCRLTHGPAEATLRLLEEEGLRPDDIERVVVGVTPAAVHLCAKYIDTAASFVRAQFSIPFVVASAVLHGTVDASSFSAERLANAAIHEFARQRVAVEAVLSESDVDIAGAEVQIVSKGGKRYRHAIPHPKGSPRNPVTEQDLKEKFVRLTEPVLGTAGSHQLWESALRFDELRGQDAVLLRVREDTYAHPR